MKTFKNEASFQAHIMSLLKELGAIPINYVATQYAGIPDLLVCYKGRFIALELKMNHVSKISELQKRMLHKIAHDGGIAKVIYAESDYVTEIETLLDVDVYLKSTDCDHLPKVKDWSACG